MRGIVASSLLFIGGMPEDVGPDAVVTYAEVGRGLLKYHVHFNNGEWTLCNAGDYQLTEIPFDTFDAVLEYINNGENCESTNSREDL